MTDNEQALDLAAIRAGAKKLVEWMEKIDADAFLYSPELGEDPPEHCVTHAQWQELLRMTDWVDELAEHEGIVAVQALRTERDGLAAVIEQARSIPTQYADDTQEYWYSWADLDRVLSAVPSDVLAEVKREAAAQALEEAAATAMRNAVFGPNGTHVSVQELRDTAAALREAGS